MGGLSAASATASRRFCGVVRRVPSRNYERVEKARGKRLAQSEVPFYRGSQGPPTRAFAILIAILERLGTSGIVLEGCARLGVWRFPVSTQGFVEVEGGRLYYERDGDGPAVVLMAGGFLDIRMYLAQVESLSRDCSLVRCDLRGFGRSSEPTTDRYRHCDDLRRLVEGPGIDRACERARQANA
jgi:hypothetical protein